MIATLDFGAFLISLDFELHWGVRDQAVSTALRQKLCGNREAVMRLLKDL
jgi:hypothetical protein